MIGERTRFRPGQSGNPGGRPKGIGAKAREQGERALGVLVAGMEDTDARIRIAAATEVLNRGWGKPLVMKAAVTGKLDGWSDDELDAGIDVLKAIIGSASPETKH